MAITPLDDLLSVDTLTGMIRTFADQSDNRSCSALFSQNARPLLPTGKYNSTQRYGTDYPCS